MLSQTFFLTTLLASLVSAGGAPQYVINVKDVVQCGNATVSWTSPPKAAGTLDMYMFTGCNDDTDDPIAIYKNIPATSNSLQMYINQLTGSTMFIQLVDADGNDYYSDDFYAGGSQGDDEDACKAHLKNANLAVITKDLSAVAVATVGATDPTDPTDTTQSDGDLTPVANAANTGNNTTTVDKITAAGALGTSQDGDASAAAKITVSPATSIILSLAGAGLLALF